MNTIFKRYLQLTLFFLDWITLNISFYVSIVFSKFYLKSQVDDFFIFFLYVNILWILIALIFSNFSEKIIIHFEYFSRRTMNVYVTWVIAVFVFFVLQAYNKFYNYFLMVLLVSFLLGILVNRFLYLGIRNYFRKKDYLLNRIIILGYNETSIQLAHYIEEESLTNYIVGYVEDTKNVTQVSHYPILAEINDLMKVTSDYSINEIYTTINPLQNTAVSSLLEQAEKKCIRFKIVPNLNVYSSKPIKIQYLRDLPILSLRLEPLEDIGNKVLKRTLDLFVSTFVIIFILSWLLPIIALIIKINSKGPIFFIQKRTGKNNTVFDCYKFRSMKLNNTSNSLQARKHDERITKVGKFLRKTSLDEFPQFFNVFKGEMSLIGPRPHMIKHTNDYSNLVDEYMIRLFLKPGITGWAQINGYRGEINTHQQLQSRINSDIWYLENWNIWLDIKIIFLTIYRIIQGDKKAY